MKKKKHRTKDSVSVDRFAVIFAHEGYSVASIGLMQILLWYSVGNCRLCEQVERRSGLLLLLLIPATTNHVLLLIMMVQSICWSDTLLVLLRRTRTVLFCVCKVSLQSFDIMPPKSLLSIIIIIIIMVCAFETTDLWSQMRMSLTSLLSGGMLVKLAANIHQ